ncbi:MAG: 2-C-methyl-D-erythritol 4-phosphate cytidylyltransferase [Spirochaetia bacterium]|nr:2-C-methyl-D-erythritol 4-phosphate cytidylyltransferase [Spirochaetia bacterium]
MKNIAVIVAAGSGKRFKSETPKQFVKAGGREILAHAIDNFEASGAIDAIVIVVSPDYRLFTEIAIVKKYGYKKVIGVIDGGAERFNSVYNAVRFIKSCRPKNVLIHDGARPHVSQAVIKSIISALKKEKAVIPVNRIYATVKEVKNGYIKSTLNRENLRTAHTPQGFDYNTLEKLYDLKKLEKLKPTDDASVFEAAGIRVRVVEDSETNLKITVKTDIVKMKKRV